jgi:hypothetical protein
MVVSLSEPRAGKAPGNVQGPAVHPNRIADIMAAIVACFFISFYPNVIVIQLVKASPSANERDVGYEKIRLVYEFYATSGRTDLEPPPFDVENKESP